MKLNRDHLAAWHFTVATILGRCTHDAETRFRDELPSILPSELKLVELGFKQAINDALETCDQWTATQRGGIKAALKARSLPPLEEMQSEHTMKKAKVLKRGRILNEEEYYLISDVLTNVASAFSTSQREKISRLISKYEEKPPAT